MYKFQQEIWQELAELNFCLYFTMRVSVERDRRYRVRGGGTERRQFTGHEWQHRLVGRRVNVATTRAMGTYLEQTIERLTRERITSNSQLFSNWAVSYRRGMAARIVEKISLRRKQKLSEERRKEKEAFDRARDAGQASTATALTLSTYIDKETDANYDFIYGEGTAAGWAADRAEQARARKEADDAYTAWAVANPEEAKKEAEERRKKARSSRYRGGSSSRDNIDWGAYRAGSEAAATVSIDPQTEGTRAPRRLK
jgi:hypothetical protein